MISPHSQQGSTFLWLFSLVHTVTDQRLYPESFPLAFAFPHLISTAYIRWYGSRAAFIFEPDWYQHTSVYFGDNWNGTHRIQAGLMAGEREGEAQWQPSTFHSHVVQEIRDAVHDMVKKLERHTIILLKGSRSFPQSPQARSGQEIGLKTSFGAICWFP